MNSRGGRQCVLLVIPRVAAVVRTAFHATKPQQVLPEKKMHLHPNKAASRMYIKQWIQRTDPDGLSEVLSLSLFSTKTHFPSCWECCKQC